MSSEKDYSRRLFLKQLAFAGAGVVAAPAFVHAVSAQKDFFDSGGARNFDAFPQTCPRKSGAKPVGNLTTAPTECVRVAFVGLGHRGLGRHFGLTPERGFLQGNSPGKNAGLLGSVLKIPFARITAVCDEDEARTKHAVELCAQMRPDVPAPARYSGTPEAWEKLCARDDIDVVYIATPWEYHAPMAQKVMRSGKHAFVEVPAALTTDECWDLVDTSEEMQRHCVILENCCFGDEEMFVLNMVRHGVFGELTHAECAYIHDLREMLFRAGTEGGWRRKYHRIFNGNLYPTHGFGPVCRYFGINRGEDRLDFLVSMSSREAGLSEFRDRGNAFSSSYREEKYVCGDMNTTLIKTVLGRTIVLRHDVVSPRPYSRINLLTGTRATFVGYPPRLALDVPEKYELRTANARTWLDERDFSKMRNRFRAAPWKMLGALADGGEYGGMDYVMNYRLLDCIKKGITPEITVYDAAAWSCIIGLSVQSAENGSVPVKIPDFTRSEQLRAKFS